MGNVISLNPVIQRVCDGVFDFGWEFGVKHAAHVYYLEDNLESLENSLGELKALREHLIRRIKLKLGFGKQTDERLEWWITRVDKQIDRGAKLKIEGDSHVDSLCLAGICSTHYFSTSKFGGQVEKCVKELNILQNVGDKFTDEDLVVIAATELSLGAKMPSDRHVDSLCLAGICSVHHFSTSVSDVQVEKGVKDLRNLKSDGEGFTDEDLAEKAARRRRAYEMSCDSEGFTAEDLAGKAARRRVYEVSCDSEGFIDEDLAGKAARHRRAYEMSCDSVGLAKMPCDSVGLEAKLHEVLTFLNEESVGIVGVYGQGGVGKTTLLMEINNHYVSRSENFLVVWIDVPKDVNLEALQQAIGEKLGLPNELKLSNIKEKALYISKALQQKKIILLLDGISKAINLSTIGIPPSGSLNDSKLVFTTRLEHACRNMEPQPGRSISIETLGEEQAWQLFVKKVGEDIYNHSQILHLAREVAKKCGGLPLALSIIGKAMSCEREPKVWENTLKSLERPSLQHSKSHREANEDSMTKLFSTLRYSYDSLPNETYKSCFLYCALFPEASEIDKDDTVKCWTFGDFSIDCDEHDLDPHFEAYHILNVLVSSCLLEDGKEWVKMHDMVRSMAL